MSDSAQQDDSLLLLEDQIKLFPRKYKDEPPFRRLVNDYLQVKSSYKIKLAFGKRLRKSWYENQVEDLIGQYATRIKDDLRKKIAIEKELAEIKSIEDRLEGSIVEIEKANALKMDATKAKASVLGERANAQQEATREEVERQQLEQELLARQQREIAMKADAERIVREKLETIVKNSSLLRKREDGQYVFNDSKMMAKLEDMFLNEILDEIAKEGKGSFIARTKSMYNNVTEFYERVSTPSEMRRANWTRSIMLSAQHGYKAPVYPFIVVGRGRGKTRASVDTALIIDRSGSMEENNRMEAARKTGGAVNALMRKLNPGNETFLAVYNSQVTPVTPLELLRIRPDNGTATELALTWIYDTLKNRGPSIGYLITDGAPNDVDAAVKAASRFQQNPQLMLRIFLIDGNRDTEQIMYRVGKAAGPRTKMASVKGYKLGGNVIRDIPDVLTEMYDLNRFSA